MSEAEQIDHEPWPLRSLILVALGAACGLIVYRLSLGPQGSQWTDRPLAMAGAAFAGAGGLVFAFSLERSRWRWSAMFAVAAGLVVAFVGWWNGSPREWGAGEGWQFFAALVAIAFAVPLFQAVRDSGGRRFPVRSAHAHAWTNLILWGAGWAFAGATILLTVLLSELFRLIGIDLLHDLLEEGWLPAMLVGAALGGAVGLLRDRANVLHLLQKVVRTILSVLAPVLAVGLILFVAFLPFTGLEPLWSQTKSTTPILLVCILGAIVLANAVVGNGTDEEARSPLLRWAAMGLAAVMLPLALVAAVSTAKRIGQHGFTPDRLWAAVFVAAAAAFAIFYLSGLVLGRRGWPAALRRANVRLAFGLCLLALFLALPIVSFGAISARSQVARLETGKVTPDRFDWAAMRFDFGPAGRRALERLAASGPAAVRPYATRALTARERWPLAAEAAAAERLASPPRLRVIPAGAAVPPALLDLIAGLRRCADVECHLLFDREEGAVLIAQLCADCEIFTRFYTSGPQGWREVDPYVGPPLVQLESSIRRAQNERRRKAIAAGRIEVRTVGKRQLFIDGEPVGPVFEP